MLTPALLAFVIATPPACAERVPAADPVPAVNREALYKQGIPFSAFLDAADERRALWVRNYGEGTVPDALLQRARAVGGTWHILAVAVDGCSDSVNTIPYLALLAEQVPGLEMRIVDSTVGREVMSAYRTPDGRAATPTVLLLDANYDEAGCFIERPVDLQHWYLANEDLGRRARYEQKMEWYEEDGGRSTLDEFVGLMEAAGGGTRGCN